jgi:hypothetical protein
MKKRRFVHKNMLKSIIRHFTKRQPPTASLVASGRLWSPVVVRSMSVVARDTSVVVRRAPVVATGRQSKSVNIYITLCLKYSYAFETRNSKHEIRNKFELSKSQ